MNSAKKDLLRTLSEKKATADFDHLSSRGDTPAVTMFWGIDAGAEEGGGMVIKTSWRKCVVMQKIKHKVHSTMCAV